MGSAAEEAITIVARRRKDIVARPRQMHCLFAPIGKERQRIAIVGSRDRNHAREIEVGRISRRSAVVVIMTTVGEPVVGGAVAGDADKEHSIRFYSSHLIR